ncbi:ATP-grasp domain-containing protein [Gordonibacter sp. An230]|uniref:ATP-grasp domain-containing protein n=1 Tax=Gordonibacter sp. An230 TaxID=1965592 RepID=UPI001EF683E9|nr:ATP-grasp domain-containing protein [Gordonibacter sp. An230]
MMRRRHGSDKTILLLGGSAQQLDSFEAARRLGYRAVLCDWDANCPGRGLADVFYETSTLDRDAVLGIARAERVDGVVSYASDAPAPVAAWVAERMGLPGNPYESVAMLCDKGRFRAFLRDNGFAAPANEVVRSALDAGKAVGRIGLPVVVKPVDSAGSRGVAVVRDVEEVPVAFDRACGFSRKGEVVVERYLESATPGRVMEAELFVEGGEVVSWGLMSAYRDTLLNGVVPSCYIHPMDECSTLRATSCSILSRIVERAGIVQGAVNVELIHDISGEIYVIDIGPRNGGNYLPNFFSHASGDDIVEATLRVAVGEPSGLRPFDGARDGLWVQFMHYARKAGTFRGFSTFPEYDDARIETHLYKEVGSHVEPLSSIGDSIGVSLLHFPRERDAESLMARLPSMCRTVVE